jgi:hypothetical protein
MLCRQDIHDKSNIRWLVSDLCVRVGTEMRSPVEFSLSVFVCVCLSVCLFAIEDDEARAELTHKHSKTQMGWSTMDHICSQVGMAALVDSCRLLVEN